MYEVPIKSLLEAGVHFGHRASRWNPKMGPYIFGKRNLIHIIDLQETLRGLFKACFFLQGVASEGKQILFVGTKRQAQDLVSEAAGKLGMPFVAERWLGGTLTNFETIRSRLRRLEELERMESDGTAEAMSKKELSRFSREKRKIFRNLHGIRDMNGLPGAMVIVDARKEKTAVAEARKMGIPTVAILDTDCDPTTVDIPIPGNDDALRSINVLLGQLVTAIEHGRSALQQNRQIEEKQRNKDDESRERERQQKVEDQRRRASEQQELEKILRKAREERAQRIQEEEGRQARQSDDGDAGVAADPGETKAGPAGPESSEG
ncbi:MAG: 30S ribosomal protein S2 [Planctomycetota bacterium]